MSANEIALPDYDKIIGLAIEEMKIKFKNYGNDWLKSDESYWKKRIFNECAEYRDSMTIDSEKRKLLNIINMCCMAFETAAKNRSSKYASTICQNCSEPLPVHMVLNNQFICNT